MGNKSARKRLKEQCTKAPLTLNGKNMKEVKVVKYLGDYLSYNVEESIHQTVIRRLGIANHAAYELRSIVEDTRAEKIGGINVAFDIFEASIVPMWLHNSET